MSCNEALAVDFTSTSQHICRGWLNKQPCSWQALIAFSTAGKVSCLCMHHDILVQRGGSLARWSFKFSMGPLPATKPYLLGPCCLPKVQRGAMASLGISQLTVQKACAGVSPRTCSAEHHGRITRHDGLDEEAEHGEHGQAAVLDLLHLRHTQETFQWCWRIPRVSTHPSWLTWACLWDCRVFTQ